MRKCLKNNWMKFADWESLHWTNSKRPGIETRNVWNILNIENHSWVGILSSSETSVQFQKKFVCIITNDITMRVLLPHEYLGVRKFAVSALVVFVWNLKIYGCENQYLDETRHFLHFAAVAFLQPRKIPSTAIQTSISLLFKFSIILSHSVQGRCVLIRYSMCSK